MIVSSDSVFEGEEGHLMGWTGCCGAYCWYLYQESDCSCEYWSWSSSFSMLILL